MSTYLLKNISIYFFIQFHIALFGLNIIIISISMLDHKQRNVCNIRFLNYVKNIAYNIIYVTII